MKLESKVILPFSSNDYSFYGKRVSDYHDIFTDHKLTIVRKRCPDCGYEPGSTIKNILGHSLSADLVKLQTEIEARHYIENTLASTDAAKELIVNVDGGHINTTEEGKRSFETMTAVIYLPESLVSNDKETRNILTSKHCAASSLDDGQKQMINNTIVAALK